MIACTHTDTNKITYVDLEDPDLWKYPCGTPRIGALCVSILVCIIIHYATLLRQPGKHQPSKKTSLLSTAIGFCSLNLLVDDRQPVPQGEICCPWWFFSMLSRGFEIKKPEALELMTRHNWAGQHPQILWLFTEFHI